MEKAEAALFCRKPYDTKRHVSFANHFPIHRLRNVDTGHLPASGMDSVNYGLAWTCSGPRIKTVDNLHAKRKKAVFSWTFLLNFGFHTIKSFDYQF